MFFKKNIAADDVVHHARMSERAIVFNIIACFAWVTAFKMINIGTLVFAPIVVLVFIVALYVHLSGVAYSIVLAGKCKLYRRAAAVFAVSTAPLLALAAFFIWGGAS